MIAFCPTCKSRLIATQGEEGLKDADGIHGQTDLGWQCPCCMKEYNPDGTRKAERLFEDPTTDAQQLGHQEEEE